MRLNKPVYCDYCQAKVNPYVLRAELLSGKILTPDEIRQTNITLEEFKGVTVECATCGTIFDYDYANRDADQTAA